MVWGNHKEKECCMGQECTKEQNEGCNQYAASAAAATIGKSQWSNLMASIHCNMLADE